MFGLSAHPSFGVDSKIVAFLHLHSRKHPASEWPKLPYTRGESLSSASIKHVNKRSKLNGPCLSKQLYTPGTAWPSNGLGMRSEHKKAHKYRKGNANRNYRAPQWRSQQTNGLFRGKSSLISVPSQARPNPNPNDQPVPYPSMTTAAQNVARKNGFHHEK